MVDCDVPDKFSIITYVSQFYHLLKVMLQPITTIWAKKPANQTTSTKSRFSQKRTS